MPDITPNQGLTLPSTTDNANGPLAFDDYNDGVENRLVQRYASATDRDIRNPTPNAGEYALVGTEYQTRVGSTWKAIRATDKTPRVAVSRSTTQSIPNAALTAMSWDTVIVNDYTSPLFNLGSPTVITLTEPGFYSVTAHVAFDANTTGFRQIRIEFATNPVASQSLIANLGIGVGVDLNISANVYTVTAIEQVRVLVYQNSGAPLNTFATAGSVPRLSVARIG